MKPAVIKGALALAALFLFNGHAWNASRAQAGAGSGSKASETKALFDARCARCHGRDGRGRTKLGEMLEAPDLTDADWQKGVSVERMKTSIRDGKGQMPAFSKKLSRGEIAALAAYVRGLAKPSR
ncbi:MAG TPA: c-type cytochrome [Pyrinomonadaceae bacterium]|nr:c-type cytochrome [Pyrinomonadaceae bacterium]